ncbi:unnamed protein product [Rhizophagus irregularis]|uniref:Uncharacterized protein n=1 Tax=Rhizophagus irregularis TaxID=588596 RepID=A0A916DZE5_9GLOM|nr:unnamed protein product [Rhizophagus irregularis]
MKSSLQASAIPFKNDVGQSIQNPEGIDFGNIISQLDLKYMKDLNITYQEQKKSYINLFGLSENHEERTERLLILYIAMIYELLNEKRIEACKIQS